MFYLYRLPPYMAPVQVFVPTLAAPAPPTFAFPFEMWRHAQATPASIYMR